MVGLNKKCEGVKGSVAYEYLEAWNRVQTKIKFEEDKEAKLLRFNDLVLKVKQIALTHSFDPDEMMDHMGQIKSVEHHYTNINGITDDNLTFSLMIFATFDGEKFMGVELEYKPLFLAQL